jgi:hypothetical protein
MQLVPLGELAGNIPCACVQEEVLWVHSKVKPPTIQEERVQNETDFVCTLILDLSASETEK